MSDGRILVSASQRSLIAVSKDGLTDWSFVTGQPLVDSPLRMAAPSIAANGIIVLGGLDGQVYLLRPNGSMIWSRSIGGPVEYSPALSADGLIFVGALDRLYCLDSNGNEKWNVQLPAKVFGPIIGPDGTIYLSVLNKGLYAIGAQESFISFTSLIIGMVAVIVVFLLLLVISRRKK